MNKSLTEVLSGINKDYGKGTVRTLSDNDSETDIEFIPSGSINLNLALGIGGYPRGRIIEIYGQESSGKTTLTLHAIAEEQKLGGTAVFIDAEHSFDRTYAESLGINLEKFI